MATPFEDVYSSFLLKISDYDWVDLDEDTNKKILLGLLNLAVARFNQVCVKNLTSTENGDSFADDLSVEEIDILSEIMVENWIKPKIYNLDLFKNRLSTKDFTTFSPANLLNSMKEIFKLSHERAESIINKYSYQVNDIRDLSK